ncbi:hypothetical protein Poli38472_012800 [Pythium oligandrum]|uniref:Uncharacterized protein n=1 Tax=Pythium oligandrum TaxID=41045 RepID=A0A8K1CEL1_PYTOL|nr:hypothetical protein Poli38472_012800 [Pythium oligandrum]|eukprot:TMW61609.1 hypothetical protein Poli38472_012800 [Pythium oligandrum]
MLWNQILFCGFSIATQSAFLTKQRFLDQPDRPARYSLCLKRVFRATFYVDILTSLFPVVAVYAIGAAAANNSSCLLRYSYYINSFAALVFTTFLSMAVRRLFLETTVAGTQRQVKRAQEIGAASPRHNKQSKRRYRHFLRVMFQVSPGTLSSAFAAGYVQVTSVNIPSSQRDLAVFAFCSIGLKLVIQELVKIVIVKRKVKDIRTMFLVVAVPTVLIDTQVRVMLQLANSVSTTVGGSIAMAFTEIGMRTGKMLFLRAQIYRKARQLRTPIGVTNVVSVGPMRKSEAVKSSPQAFEIWKMQLLRFHAAEAYADMAAEYMALGSSAMIVAVYADHPKYELGRWQFGINTSSSNASSRYIILLGLQLAIEIFVDTVSCVVETIHGVNFDELKKYESFVMALFIVIGIMNVQITAIMYLKCE